MSMQNIKVLYELIMPYILKLIIKEKRSGRGCMFITFCIDFPSSNFSIPLPNK
jgi:hypothetical protein